MRYALAGRSKEKLRKVHSENDCGKEVPIFVAESDDVAAISNFVGRARVIIAVAGPFKLYSDVVVGACARLGTHYVDITGEAAWVRSVVDRYDGIARSTGAVICNMCGFDSVPFDLGTLYAINRLRARTSATSIRRVTAYIAVLGGGGFSGGTLATGMSNVRTPVQLTKGVDLNDPFILGGLPKGGCREEDTDNFAFQVHMLGEHIPCGPSHMHTVNSRMVRRSSQLLGWGPNFNYVELLPVPSREFAQKMADQQRNPAPPEVIEKLMAQGVLPKPGEGPKPEVRRQTRFTAIIDCLADDGSRLVTTMRGGEPGYEETARMVLEAGLALLQETHSCPAAATGGCFSPAAGLGEVLIRRLQEVGMRFAVEKGDAAAVVAALFQPRAKL